MASDADKRRQLMPEHEVLRLVECLDGEVEVDVRCDPRPGYGRTTPRLINGGRMGICYAYGAEALFSRSELPLTLDADTPGATGRARLRAGDRRYLSLVYTHGEPAVLPVFGAVAEQKIGRALRWWRGWAARCRYTGPHRAAVLRSALTLKLLTYAPSGAVVAAPTTSLPEWPGGIRNWDYRYCWLRDASLTLRALMDLGYEEEAEAFASWMLHATRLTWPELKVMSSTASSSGRSTVRTEYEESRVIRRQWRSCQRSVT